MLRYVIIMSFIHERLNCKCTNVYECPVNVPFQLPRLI